MTGELFLGIEGGATRTAGVLADGDVNVVATHQAGPANIRAVGEAAARAAVKEILDALLASAGGWESVAASAFCMAGLRGPSDRDAWRRIVAECGVPEPVLLTHDGAAGLAAGSPDLTGVLVVCGTGSLVYGRSADGREHFVGGRGCILGDEASGFDIGRKGLRAAARAADRRGPATTLQHLIPDRFGLADIDDLIAWASPFAKDRVASVAPVVLEAAAAGDSCAGEIVRAAADELARCVQIVAEQLWPPGDWPDRLDRVVLSGGVLRSQPDFRRAVASAIRKLLPDAACVVPEVDGAVGAARLAKRLASSQ